MLVIQAISLAGSNVALAPNGSVALTALAGGNVGIGTTSPYTTLDVRGGTNQRLFIYDLTTLGNPTTEVASVNDANTANEPMELDASKFNFNGGNVGIGVTNPGAMLTVGAGGVPHAATFYSNSGTAGTSALRQLWTYHQR